MNPTVHDTSRALARWWALGVGALTVAVFAVLMLWGQVSAPFSLGDEPRHFNSVLRLMQGGGWPPPKSAPMLEGTFLASAEAGHALGDEDLAVLPLPADRSVIGGMSDPVPGEIDWMTQHPPAYYALVAATMKVVGGDQLRWDELLLAMRTFSSAIAALAVPFIAGAARLVTGSKAAALVGASVVLAIPQFGHVMSLVTNDVLVTTIGAILLYLSARAMVTAGGLWWTSALAGVALGIGLLTKGLMLAAIPCVFLALLIAGWRSARALWRRLAPAALAMVIAFCIGGWWWLRNLIVLGEVQPSMMGSGRSPEPAEGTDIWFFIGTAAARLNNTFWGSIRESLALPAVVTATAGIAAVAAILITIVFSRRRGVFLVLMTYPILTASLFLYHSWEIYWNFGRTPGIQGRYLYGAVAILAIALAFCVSLAVARLPSPASVAIGLAAMGVFLVSGAYGLRFTFRAEWASEGGWNDAVASMLGAGPWSTAQIAVVLMSLGLALALLAVAFVVLVRSRQVRDGTVESPATASVTA